MSKKSNRPSVTAEMDPLARSIALMVRKVAGEWASPVHLLYSDNTVLITRQISAVNRAPDAHVGTFDHRAPTIDIADALEHHWSTAG